MRIVSTKGVVKSSSSSVTDFLHTTLGAVPYEALRRTCATLLREEREERVESQFVYSSEGALRCGRSMRNWRGRSARPAK